MTSLTKIYAACTLIQEHRILGIPAWLTGRSRSLECVEYVPGIEDCLGPTIRQWVSNEYLYRSLGLKKIPFKPVPVEKALIRGARCYVTFG